MRRNYLINAIYLTFIVFMFVAFKILGFQSVAMLRQDTIYYILYFPINIIFVVFGFWYVGFGTKWKQGPKANWTSILSILVSVLLFVLAILLPRVYDTFGSGLQALTFVIMFVLVLINIVAVTVLNKKRA